MTMRCTVQAATVRAVVADGRIVSVPVRERSVAGVAVVRGGELRRGVLPDRPLRVSAPGDRLADRDSGRDR
jgi:hypothetical protein